MTAVTLILGWPLAVVAGVLASVCTAAVHLQPWTDVAYEALLLGAVPASLSALALWIVERFLPKNPFVFILGVSFFGAIMAAALTRVLVAGYLILAGAGDPAAVLGQTRTILLLTSFPEGVINGIAVTTLVVFRPQWVRRFNATRYMGSRQTPNLFTRLHYGLKGRIAALFVPPEPLHLQERERRRPGNEHQPRQRLRAREKADGPHGREIAESQRGIDHGGKIDVVGQSDQGQARQRAQAGIAQQHEVAATEQPDLENVHPQDRIDQQENAGSATDLQPSQHRGQYAQRLVVHQHGQGHQHPRGDHHGPMRKGEIGLRGRTRRKGGEMPAKGKHRRGQSRNH